MSRNRIIPHMTPGRLKLLKRALGGPVHDGTVCGYQCRKLGWVEFVIPTTDGRLLTYDELVQAFGKDDAWEHWDREKRWLNRITDAGRTVLQHQGE